MVLIYTVTRSQGLTNRYSCTLMLEWKMLFGS
jgi:hypothetical protein